MNDIKGSAAPSGMTSIHTLENEMLLYIYKEAMEIQTSEEFLRMLESELERRNLSACI